jgi:hypothetical protein
MAVYGYHEYPEVLRFDSAVLESQPGRAVLRRSLAMRFPPQSRIPIPNRLDGHALDQID